jgi:signal peptidase I
MKKPRQKPTTWYGKTWYFIWHDNSLLSWVVNVILAFVLIKFIIYPGAGLIMGTKLPVVAVVSESMEHRGSFENWWASPAVCDTSRCTQSEWYASRNITKDDFIHFPFKSGFNKGDIMVIIGDDPQDIRVGDIIVYQARKEYPIIHRVVKAWPEGDSYVFATKGDHNEQQIVCPQELWYAGGCDLDERYISQDKVYGKAAVRIPWLGWVKLGAVEGVNYIRGLF